MAEFVPVDHDPFAPQSGRQLVPIDHDPFAPSGQVTVASDVAQAIPSGVAKGVAALAGLPGTIGDLWNQGADAALSYLAPKIGMTPEMVAETRAAISKGREHSAIAAR